LSVLTDPHDPSAPTLAAAAQAALAADLGGFSDMTPSPWRALAGFRLNAAPSTEVRLFYEGRAVLADAAFPGGPSGSTALADAGDIVVFEAGNAFSFSLARTAAAAADAASDGAIRSPMPGKVTLVSAEVGDTVRKGQTLLTLEAMKMEYSLSAPFDGVVAELSIELGAQVAEGAILARMTEA
jgi:biotin carboxyl carrier protein